MHRQLGSAPSLVAVDGVLGIVLEVADLAATRAFYDPIFASTGGAWDATGESLAFRVGQQTIEFVPRPQPRTLPESGQHQAYRVPALRLQGVLDALETAGHKAD